MVYICINICVHNIRRTEKESDDNNDVVGHTRVSLCPWWMPRLAECYLYVYSPMEHARVAQKTYTYTSCTHIAHTNPHTQTPFAPIIFCVHLLLLCPQKPRHQLKSWSVDREAQLSPQPHFNTLNPLNSNSTPSLCLHLKNTHISIFRRFRMIYSIYIYIWYSCSLLLSAGLVSRVTLYTPLQQRNSFTTSRRGRILKGLHEILEHNTLTNTHKRHGVALGSPSLHVCLIELAHKRDSHVSVRKFKPIARLTLKWPARPDLGRANTQLQKGVSACRGNLLGNNVVPNTINGCNGAPGVWCARLAFIIDKQHIESLGLDVDV